jgi:hypothetical protein
MIDPTKLHRVLKSIEAKHGPFVLAGLFMREDSPGLWDLVVSAPWLQRWDLVALRRFVRLLSEALGQQEILSLSRIVTFNRNDPALKRILQEIGTTTEPVEKFGRNLFGLSVEHAYVFRAHGKARSNRRVPVAPQTRRG